MPYPVEGQTCPVVKNFCEDGMGLRTGCRAEHRLRERQICEAKHMELMVPHNGFGWTGTRCSQCGFMFFGEWEPEFAGLGQKSQ